jgi:hypothetical protein
MIEILVALLAGVVGGVLSRWIPAFPKKKDVRPDIFDLSAIGVGEEVYEVELGDECLYLGGDLHIAKALRTENPGAVLIADGVNRG